MICYTSRNTTFFLKIVRKMLFKGGSIPNVTIKRSRHSISIFLYFDGGSILNVTIKRSRDFYITSIVGGANRKIG